MYVVRESACEKSEHVRVSVCVMHESVHACIRVEKARVRRVNMSVCVCVCLCYVVVCNMYLK